MTRGVYDLVGIAFCVLLMFSGGAKLVGGYNEGGWLGPELYFTIGVLELVGAVFLATRLARWVAVGGVVMAMGGVLYAWLGGDSPCGCLGAIEMSKHEHILWASAFGALAALWLFLGAVVSEKSAAARG